MQIKQIILDKFYLRLIKNAIEDVLIRKCKKLDNLEKIERQVSF